MPQRLLLACMESLSKPMFVQGQHWQTAPSGGVTALGVPTSCGRREGDDVLLGSGRREGDDVFLGTVARH